MIFWKNKKSEDDLCEVSLIRECQQQIPLRCSAASSLPCAAWNGWFTKVEQNDWQMATRHQTNFHFCNCQLRWYYGAIGIFSCPSWDIVPLWLSALEPRVITVYFETSPLSTLLFHPSPSIWPMFMCSPKQDIVWYHTASPSLTGGAMKVSIQGYFWFPQKQVLVWSVRQ